MDASSISGTHLLPHIPHRTIRILIIIGSEQLVHERASRTFPNDSNETHFENGASVREYGMWHSMQGDVVIRLLLLTRATVMLPPTDTDISIVGSQAHLLLGLVHDTSGDDIMENKDGLRRPKELDSSTGFRTGEAAPVLVSSAPSLVLLLPRSRRLLRSLTGFLIAAAVPLTINTPR